MLLHVNFITSLLCSRLLQHKVISGYQKTLHDCKKQATQSSRTVPIVTPVFPYYVPLYLPLRAVCHIPLHTLLCNIAFNAREHQSTVEHINQQMQSIKCNNIQAIQYNSWAVSNCCMFRHRSAILRETPEQRNTSTVRLYT